MLVKEVMNKDVKTIEPDATIREAAEIMNESRIGSLVVVKDKEVVGILTERTILTDVVAEAKNSEEVKVKDIMVKKLITVDPNASLEDAAELMVKHKIKKLPVVAAGNLVGIVTASDLITYEKRLIEKVATLMIVAPKINIAG